MILIKKLSYGLISLLSTKPMTGYDLTLRINKFSHSSHSAIYPLLSDLEEKGYIEFELRKQLNKPDKKIYSLTDKGMELLREWFISDTKQSIVRDEMSFKISCMQIMDDDLVNRLLDEIEERYKKRLDNCKKAIEMMSLSSSDDMETAFLTSFGNYVLTQRIMNEAIIGIEWCIWVRGLFKNKKFQLLNQNFKEMMEKD
nr:helix-turn-helix transcriptional regulator [Sedimentibacter sp.]